jgi:hypothetical protein
LDDWGVVKAGKFTICQARDPRYLTDDITNSHREKGTDPWEANALAIAALPELIEAAETTLEYLKEEEISARNDDDEVRDFQEISIPVASLRTLRSALLKAKGGEG